MSSCKNRSILFDALTSTANCVANPAPFGVFCHRLSFFGNSIAQDIGKVTVHVDSVTFAYATDCDFGDLVTDVVLNSTLMPTDVAWRAEPL